MVIGSRYLNGNSIPLYRRIGQRVLDRATNINSGINVTDTQSGFRAFRTKIFPKIVWNSARYSVETEMIVNAGKHKLKFSEINIDTIYQDNYKGTTIIDGIKIFFNMLIWLFV